MNEMTEKQDRQSGVHQIGYWVGKAAEEGSPSYPMLWAVWQIAKVLWRIYDRLGAIEAALTNPPPTPKEQASEPGKETV